MGSARSWSSVTSGDFLWLRVFMTAPFLPNHKVGFVFLVFIFFRRDGESAVAVGILLDSHFFIFSANRQCLGRVTAVAVVCCKNHLRIRVCVLKQVYQFRYRNRFHHFMSPFHTYIIQPYNNLSSFLYQFLFPLFSTTYSVYTHL